MLPPSKSHKKIVAILSLMVLLSGCDNEQIAETTSTQDMSHQDALWKEHQKNVQTLESLHKNFADVLENDPMYKAMSGKGTQVPQGK